MKALNKIDIETLKKIWSRFDQITWKVKITQKDIFEIIYAELLTNQNHSKTYSKTSCVKTFIN